MEYSLPRRKGLSHSEMKEAEQKTAKLSRKIGKDDRYDAHRCTLKKVEKKGVMLSINLRASSI